MAARELSELKARPTHAGTAPEVGEPKDRLNLERRIDVTDGVAYTRA